MRTPRHLALTSLILAAACDAPPAELATLGPACNELLVVDAQPLTPELAELRGPPEGSCHHGGFEGKLPCVGCERVKVLLTLHLDLETRAPTTYVLERIHVGRGDARTITRGSWSRSVGTSWDDDAVVYTLAGDTPDELSRWLALRDNLLLLLDPDLEPRVGDGAHNYTLSRTR